MKLLGRLFLVLGIVALIPSGLTAFRGFSQAREHDARIREYAAEHATVTASLYDLNLEYRGYQKSVPTMPDSIRLGQSAIILGTFRDYNKKISALESGQEELARKMRREELRKEEVLADTRRVSAGLGGCSLVLIVLGLVLGRRARRFGLGVDGPSAMLL